MLYVVTKNTEGEFTGFCSAAQFNKTRDLFMTEDDASFETFEGPDNDGTDAAFNAVKQLALRLCSNKEI